MANNLQAKIAFAKWLAKNDPFLFRATLKAYQLKTGRRGASQMQGLFDDIDWGSIATGITDTVKNVAPALIQYKAQAAALKTNLQRARQGQPPINFQDYTPTVKVAPQITPETERAITRVAVKSVKETGVKELLPWLFGGVVAAFALPQLMRAARR